MNFCNPIILKLNVSPFNRFLFFLDSKLFWGKDFARFHSLPESFARNFDVLCKIWRGFHPILRNFGLVRMSISTDFKGCDPVFRRSRAQDFTWWLTPHHAIRTIFFLRCVPLCLDYILYLPPNSVSGSGNDSAPDSTDETLLANSPVKRGPAKFQIF